MSKSEKCCILVVLKPNLMKGSDRLLGVGVETVLGLTGYHCRGMSELFADLGIAQCRPVFGCSLLGLHFLHHQSVRYHLRVLLQQWNNSDARQCRLTVEEKLCP